MRLSIILICGFLLQLLTPRSGWCQDMQERLPRLDEMTLPTVEQLLTGPPRDWVILDTDEVIVTEPIAPRPDTVVRLRQEQEKLRAELSRTSGDEREEIRKRVEEMNFLFVVLPDTGSSEEFKVALRRVKEIRHREDLMIRRIDLLLEEKNVSAAMELLLRLERTWDSWPNLEETHNKILFTDAALRLEKNEPEQALMLMNELYERSPEFAGLSERTGQVVDLLARRALDAGAFRQAQFFLNRLSQRYANHPVFQKYSDELTALTQQKLDEAAAATAQGDHRQAAIAAEEAARIWPRTKTLRTAHRAPIERYQRLHAGVLSFPGETQAYFVKTAADLREQRFLEIPLFEIDRVTDGTAYYRTRFFDEWEPLNLGRRMRFTLKRFKQPHEMQSLLTSYDIVQPILERLDPGHATYDERLAAMIDSVSIQSPIQFTLEFRRVPPRLEPHLARIFLGDGQAAALAGGFGGFGAGPDSASAADEGLSTTTDPGGFEVLEVLGDRLSYVRKTPEPDGLPQYHVAEIVEHRYESYEKAVQGLLRGEVTMLPDVPDWIVRRMQADENFTKQYFISPYGMPTTHLIQFNPASEPLKVRELRRALAYAIDRERLLKEVILRDPDAVHGRLATGPFPSNSPARSVSVEQTRYDLSSAVAMALTATRKLKAKIPTLRMIVVPGVIEEEAAEDMIRIWKKVGIDVELVKAQSPLPESWDMMYRTHQMPEPTVELWPFLAMQDRARLSDLERFPDWFKQDLVDLDRISDQSRADVALQDIHRKLWIDMSLIPLWEVDQHIIIRKTVHEFPAQPVHPYDRVDRWVVDAWYEAELPQ